MKKLILFVLIILVFAGCQQKQAVKDETTAEQKPVSVFAQTFHKRDLPEFSRISATLEAKTDVVMISEVNGKLLSLHKGLGDWVNKDETIGEIDSEIIEIQLAQLEAGVLAAETTLQTAGSNLAASKQLWERKIISQAEYESAIGAEKGAKAQYDGTLAQKRQVEKMLENARITAPVSGYISELPVTIGNFISQGSILCRIVDSRILMIKTGVGKSIVKQLEKGQKVLLTTKTGGKQLEGIISGFGVAPMLGSVNYPIEIEVKNEQGLLAGEIVEANILLNLHHDVFVTRQDALVREFDKTYFYFINADNIVERKEIKIEQTIGDQLIVTGVAEGDRIVAIGTENVEQGSRVEIRQEIEE
ncbi:MAG: efflux RND transporter periplasmic adaptor subunit [Candidatus Cloacimonetes bacterium]|nr:efflux RND transporter periplasmic adaptor subunit [Candidatus Cloacimonadota bacterium]